MGKLICLGTQCKCDKGVTILSVVGGEQNFLSGKKSILLDNSKVVGSFGICQALSQKTGNPTPCVIATDFRWQDVSKSITVNGKKPLLEKSYLKCRNGGKIELAPLKSNIEVNE